MACNCGENWSSMIRTSCADPASREDVITALETLAGNCCLGTLLTAGLRPTDNATVAFAEAFPNGVSACNCDCVYMYNQTDNEVFINCTEDYEEDLNWEMISKAFCFGQLTTVALTPDESEPSKIASIAEAFPDGLDSQCDVYYITREDGILCYSTDGGTSFNCLQPVEPDQVYEIITPRTVLGSSSASIVISSIPSTYDHLVLVGQFRTDGTGATGYESVYFRLNADSGSNYYNYSMSHIDTVVSAGGNVLSFGSIGAGAVNNAGANLSTAIGHGEMIVYRYGTTTYHRNIKTFGSMFRSATTTHGAGINGFHRWANAAAAVSSITLTPAASANFVTGTNYALYGVRGSI